MPQFDTSARRRTAAVVSLVLLASGVGAATYSAYTDQETITNNVFTSGYLDLELGENTTAFNVSGMAPGDTQVKEIVLRNAGTMPLTYDAELARSVLSGNLAEVLEVSLISDLASPPSAAGIWEGVSFVRQDGFPEASTTASSATSRPLAVGESETLYAHVHMKKSAPADYMGTAANLTFTFNALQDVASHEAETPAAQGASFTYDVTTPATPVTLPMAGAVDVTVDWGDGTVATYTTNNPAHTYETAGQYDVQVDGTYTAMTLPSGKSNAALTSARLPQDAGVTSMANAFLGATNLRTVSGALPATVTSVQNMFASAKAFNGDISSWDTKNVTDMSYMFYDASAFNRDLSGWNTSKVTDMNTMFYNTTSFNSDLSGWDTKNVTNMKSMFQNATAFNGDISGWNTGNVTDMSSMFAGATSFNGDISGWDTKHVTNMKSMFQNATAFNGNISGWNTGNVRNMSGAFNGATSFNGAISGWNTARVTNMLGMFDGAKAFNGDISGWSTVRVTDMSSMFSGATSFNRDISGWNITKVTDMNRMFNGATAFNQNLSAWNLSRLAPTSKQFFANNTPQWTLPKPTGLV